MRKQPGKRERITSVVVYLCFFAMAAVLGFFSPLGNVDELWNFTFGNNVAMGLVPYRDFNLLQTPLFSMIHGLVLAIFGRELLVTRMLGALLFSGICFLLYKFSRKMGMNVLLSCALPVAFLAAFDQNVFYEYSCTILFMQLLCMYIDCSTFMEEERAAEWFRARTQMLCGVASGIAIMCKQTFGGFVALASWIAVCLICRYYRTGKYRMLKLLGFRLLGSSLPCFFVLFYLLGTGSFADMVDMCIKGVSSFSGNLMLWDYMTENTEYLVIGGVFLLTIYAGISYTLVHRRQKEGKLGLLVLLYSFLGCINLYPLCNSYHILTCLFPFTVLLMPLLSWLGRKKWVSLIGSGAVMLCACYLLYTTASDTKSENVLLTDIDHFHGIYMDREQIEDYRIIVEEILDRKENDFEVYILDNEAVQYLIPADIYHKYLDMFLLGNLGTKTPKECLNDTLYSEKQAIYLLPSDLYREYQFPRTDIEEFIEEHLDYAQTIGHYDCYVAR